MGRTEGRGEREGRRREERGEMSRKGEEEGRRREESGEMSKKGGEKWEEKWGGKGRDK